GLAYDFHDHNSPARDSPSCNGIGQPWVWTLSPATGDSWRDNVTSNTPLRYDESKGVAFYSNAAWGGAGCCDWFNHGAAFYPFDQSGFITGMQFKSESGEAVGVNMYGMVHKYNIFDGGGPLVVQVTANYSFANNLYVSRSEEEGCAAIHSR